MNNRKTTRLCIFIPPGGVARVAAAVAYRVFADESLVLNHYLDSRLTAILDRAIIALSAAKITLHTACDLCHSASDEVICQLQHFYLSIHPSSHRLYSKSNRQKENNWYNAQQTSPYADPTKIAWTCHLANTTDL